ncbi:hypothetical protein PLESTB_001201000 [Pleodorina starrii]|uniref:Trafficking protein particle complex subunit 8 n=1 Tax=Pleodorina starrii TaxID=330485 RepID=A0A9W6F5G1_9CHLO|nr:hypothetical protein PLESTB_001201000 [Pleodorina starrii]
MDIRPWLQDLYAPAVLVAATPAAEAVVQVKNGLSLVDLLRPYSSVYQLNVPVRVGESSVRVQDLRVRFYDAATLYQPPPEVIEEQLQEVLKAAAQRHARLDPVPDLLQRFTSGVYAIPADVVNPASHFDTLVAQLVMPPLMQQDVMYTVRDKDFPRHYVLLLDVAAGMSEKRATENLAAIRKLYGEAHCSLLRVNSGNGDRAHSGAPVDFFARYQHACLRSGGAGEPLARPPQPPSGVGAHLTVQDLDSVGSLVRDVVSRTLLPRLEERIARLNASITATRRGLRNRLNRFWKGTAEDRQTDRPYPWHSVEGQMRQLGDLAFLLRQYAFAESTYRLAAQDYQAEGNSKWYAGVEEMIGLCTVLGEPADPIAAVLLQNDPMKYFMRAYEHYIKPPAAVLAAAAAVVTSAGGQGAAAAAAAAVQAPPAAAVAASKVGRMLATRVILLGAAVQSAAGRHRATSDALMRAQSEEENARAGLLLEQSAYSMLYARPPLMRKFAFQMVLAGIRYICCGQKRIAIHAYRQVLALYLGKKWRYIEEHLHAVLGAQCVEYGDKERALWHFCSLLDCGHRPPAQQANNVAQFLNLLTGIRDQLAITQDGASLVDRLPLPVVNRHDVRVLCSDSACYAGPAARTVPDSTWVKMEACCTSGSNNWLVDPGGLKQEKDHEEFTMCVRGEEVGVQVEFRNPLAVKLKVTNVRLICSFTPDGDVAPTAAVPVGQAAAEGSGGGGGGGSSVLLADGAHPLLPGQAPAAISAQPGNEFIMVSEAQLTLHPGEALVEVLRVAPHAPGWLRITGVTWTLNGVAHGRIAFDVKGRRRKRPKGTRPGQLKHFPPHRRLLFQVVPTMPRLELLADPLPPALYSGELCRVMMRIRNGGGLPLRSLALVVGHPEAVVPATDANKDRPLLDSLTDPREVVQLSKVPASARGGLQLYRLWPGRELAPGEVLEWPLWLHPRGVGTLKLPLVWYGEPAIPGAKGAMRHRTLRICGSVAVQPLLAARPTVWPSPTHLSHSLLRLAVDNSKEGERVVLQQVAAVTVPPLNGGGGGGQGAATTPGAGTPPTPSASSARAPPAGWRISLLGSQSSSPAGAAAEQPPPPPPAAAAAAAGDGDGAAAAAPPRSLPLAVPLQPGESASLFLQLIAPPPRAPPPPQQQPHKHAAGAASAEARSRGSSAHGMVAAAAGHGAAISPPASGLATPGAAGSEDPGLAVVQAVEAVRSLALTDGGAAAGPSGRLPYVDGADVSLQRMNLYGPGVLAHFYRRGRRGMVATIGAAAAAAAAAPTGAGPPGPAGAGPRGAAAQALGPPPPPPGAIMPPTLQHSASTGGLPHHPLGGAGLGPAYPGLHGPTQQQALQQQQHPHPHPQLLQAVGSFQRGTPPYGPGGVPQGFNPVGPQGLLAPGAGAAGRPLGPTGPAVAAPGAVVPASAPGGSGPGRPGQSVPLADPPLDLLLLWHVAVSTRTGPHQGQQRIGLCRPFDPPSGRDLSGCLQAQTAPIRMLLTGPNGASSAASSAGSAGPVVRHDFRRSALAVVPLRLVVRNNMGVEARLQVEVGEGWQSTDAPHSWQASTAILGSSPGANLGPAAPSAMSQGVSGGGAGHQAASAASGAYAGATGGGAGGMAAGPASAGPTGGGGGGGAGGGLGGSGGLMTSGSSITYQAGLPPCPEYSWVGPTSVAVPRVEPGGEVEVPLTVAVFRPGAYCVAGYRCTAIAESSGAVEVQRGEPLCFRVES